MTPACLWVAYIFELALVFSVLAFVFFHGPHLCDVVLFGALAIFRVQCRKGFGSTLTPSRGPVPRRVPSGSFLSSLQTALVSLRPAEWPYLRGLRLSN